MKPTLLVMAAGMGSRYGGLKQVDPVGPSGETLMDYAVYDALKGGFDRAVFVVRRDFAEDFKRRVDGSFGRHIAVDYAYQELDDLPAGFGVPSGRTKPWGTAHAVRAAREIVTAPFAAINADDYYGREGFEKLGRFLAASAPAAAGTPESLAMVGYELRQTLTEHGSVARGLCQVDACDQLTSVVEHTKVSVSGGEISTLLEDGTVEPLEGSETVSMNLWGFTPACFDLLEADFKWWLAQYGETAKVEWFLSSVVSRLVERRQATVTVLPTASHWFGVTYREDRQSTIAAIAKLVAAGVYPARLWP